jgi:uncharacterized protein YjbI with pentapeptide repeats
MKRILSFAVVCGSLALTGCGSSPQDKIASRVEALGGKVDRDSAQPGNPVTAVYLGGKNVTDADLKEIGTLPQLKAIFLTKTKISDAGVEPLFALVELEELNFENTDIGDATLKNVARLPKLKRLSLQDTKISDAGLAELAACAALEEIWLAHAGITDAGLEHLAKLPNLKRADVRATKITDAGLEHLAKRPSLRHVYLNQTEVTTAGAEKLRKALPEATVFFTEGAEIAPSPPPEAAPEPIAQ